MRSLPQKWTSSRWHLTAAFGGTLALLTILTAAADAWWHYRVILDHSRQSAELSAKILARTLAQSFDAVNGVLHQTELMRLNLEAAATRDADPSAIARAAFARLQALRQTSPLFASIGWTDATGAFVAYSDASAAQMPNLVGHELLTVLRDGGSDRLVIAARSRDSTTGDRLVTATRRLTGSDGSFAGVAAAVLDRNYLSDTLRSVRLGVAGSVRLLTRDGEVLAQDRNPQADPDNAYAGDPIVGAELKDQEAARFAFSGPDGVARNAAYGAVPGLPLAVVVTYSRAEALDGWRRHLLIIGPVAASVAALLLLAGSLVARQVCRLVGKVHALELTMENLAHGLTIFDGARRLTASNACFAEMYGLTAAQTKVGTSFRSLLAALAPKLKGPAPAQQKINQRVERSQSQASYHTVNEMCDGRVISVNHQPMPDGGWIAVHHDITDRRRVAHMAHHDLLTGMANRAYFMEQLEAAVERTRRRHEPFAIFMLDLDKFKKVNDSLGHPAGDAVLQQTAERLRSVLRDSDTLARLGGDEFAIILSGDADPREAAPPIANRIIDLITESYDISGQLVHIGTSVGIAVAPTDGVDPETLMKKADLALYRTKSTGRNDYCFFDDGMTADVDSRRQLETELRAALAGNGLEVHYQPIIDVSDETLFGVEALARWRHPIRGYIPPSEFIPVAEETGLIASLGEWVLQTACADAVKWPRDIKVAVNISPVQFRKSNLLDIILCTLAETGLAPERLELEITESTLLDNEAAHLATLRQLQNLGVSINLDDFGTGYSSLSYLTMFPFNKIKIDKSFTGHLTRRADCAAIVSSVLALGAGLDLPTVAEGVETRQQFEILRASGVKFVQGYLFGRPGPMSDIDFDLGREPVVARCHG